MLYITHGFINPDPLALPGKTCAKSMVVPQGFEPANPSHNKPHDPDMTEDIGRNMFDIPVRSTQLDPDYYEHLNQYSSVRLALAEKNYPAAQFVFKTIADVQPLVIIYSMSNQ